MLNIFEKNCYNEIICCGDIIGIGPYPEETVQRIMSPAYNNPYIAKLLELDIVYCHDDQYMQKYMELRSKVVSKLNQVYSIKDNEKAEKFVNEASKEYACIMLSSKYGECRYATISTMEYLPIGFNELYWKLIKAGSVKEIKEISTRLMKAIKKFAK